MLDQQHRITVIADRPDQLDECGLLARVESGGRLVEAQQFGLGRQSPGDLQASLVAVGEILGLLLPPVGDPDELQQRSGLLNGRTLLPPVPRGAQQRARHRGAMPRIGADDHILQRGHLAPQPDVLEGARDAQPGDLVTLAPADRFPVEHHGAGRRAVNTGDGVETGGLPGAVGADQSQNLTAANREAHRVQGGQAAEFHGEIGGLQQGLPFGRTHVAVQGRHLFVDHRFGHDGALSESARASRARADFP